MKKIFSFVAAMVFALAANAAEVNITAETSNSLKTAVAAATAGDVIILADGVYNEPEQVKLDKSLTIKAAEGAHPVLALHYYCSLTNGAQVTFQGIKFDGAAYTASGVLTGASDHCIRPYDNSTNKSLTVIDCEFCNWSKGYILYPQRADRCVQSITIQNCYFHDNARSAVYVETGSSSPCPLAELNIENSTFVGTSASYKAIDVKNGGEAVADAKIRIDHCTFYNYGPVRSEKSTDVIISNSIFAFPTAGATATTLYAGAAINNSLTFNMAHAEGPTVTNPVEGDPLFADAANGDFTLSAGSPALGAATDGSDLGDPRWFPAAAGPVLENGFYLVGTINNWTPAAEYHLVGNPDNNAEFMVAVTLAVGDGIKVCNVVDDNVTAWYPDGNGNEYVVDAAHAGEKTIYFQPDYKADWAAFGGYMWIDANPEPQPEENVVYNWSTNAAEQIGTTILGNVDETITTVNIHENQDAVDCIKFGKSYVYADGKWIAIKPAEGGFKAGDILSVAIVFNNTDNTKYAQVDLRAANGDTRIWLSDSASTVNGRYYEGEPIVQTYTLEADQDSLFLGRYGNTGMCITTLKVVRPAGEQPQPELPYMAIIGDMNNWAGTELVLAEDGLTASCTINLAMNENRGYGFKVLVGDKAYCIQPGENWYAFHRDWTSESGIDHEASDNEAFWLVIDKAGDYTFTWTMAEKKLAITFPELEYVTYYFVNTMSWDNVYAYAWDPAIAEWPGEQATLTEQTIWEYPIYSYTMLENRKNIIFNDGTGGEGHQTADLVVEDGKPYYYKTQWYASLNDVATAISNTAIDAQIVKMIENGQLIIIKNGVRYNVMGIMVK